MARTPVHTFTLPDRDGNPHEYVMSEHPADSGLDVIDRLLALGLGPVVSLMLKTFDLPQGDSEADEAKRKTAWGDILKSIDVVALTDNVSAGILKGNGLRTLAPLLLAHTFRDGQKLTGVEFGAAYQGNYGEMISAAKKSIDVNGFIAALSTFTAA